MGSLYAKDVIEKARSFIGYHEGPNNDNYFADVLDGCDYFAPQTKQYVPWCAVFCDCCALLAAIPEDRDNDSKKYDAQYFYISLLIIIILHLHHYSQDIS